MFAVRSVGISDIFIEVISQIQSMENAKTAISPSGSSMFVG